VGSWNSYPFISCGGKVYCVTGIGSAQKRFQTSERPFIYVSSWMHQSGKTTWVSKAGMSLHSLLRVVGEEL